jgi:hypothetical protein
MRRGGAEFGLFPFVPPALTVMACNMPGPTQTTDPPALLGCLKNRERLPERGRSVAPPVMMSLFQPDGQGTTVQSAIPTVPGPVWTEIAGLSSVI